MNEGQAPVNFFTINGGGNTAESYNIFSDSAGQINSNNTINQNINPGVKTQHLDLQLQQEGLNIDKQMSQESKQAFVDGLTNSQYQKMLEFKNAGYSFEASKSLLEQTMGVNGGGYRGEGFQLGEPLGGKNGVWNNMNFIGRFTEIIDDAIQSIPDVDIRGRRSKALTEKLNNLTEEQRADYEARFNNLSDRQKKRFGDVRTFAEEQNKSFLDQLFGAEDNLDYGKDGPNVASQFLNIPGSLLKTASATVRGMTNPLDTLNMLKNLAATEEGREIIKQRYGTLAGFAEAMEKDPVGVASDALAVAELGAGAVTWGAKGAGTVSRMAGMADTASKLSKFADDASRFGANVGGASDLGVGIPLDSGLNSALGRMAEGNKASQIAGAYIGMTQKPLQTIWKGANPNGESYVFPGIQKKVDSVLDRAKETIKTTATGITPEERARIQNNPYVREYWERVEQMLDSEGAPIERQRIMEEGLKEVGDELIRRLDEYEARLEETGPIYDQLKATTRQHNMQGAYSNALGVFSRHQITMDSKGNLKFADMILPTDMNPIQTARNLIQKAQRDRMTARDFLNLRRQLSDLAKFDSGTTSRGVKVIKELRAEVNKIAKKEIPGLEKADDLYSRQINELKEARQGLVYQQGERKGQIRDNYHSILKNLGTQNRKQMAMRLEKIYPDLADRVEAINMLPKMAGAYQGAPQMMKNIFKTTGAMSGLKYGNGIVSTAMAWVLGIALDELIGRPLGEKRRKVAIDELLSEMSPEAQQKLTDIYTKQQAGLELTEQDKQTLALAVQEIIEDEARFLNEEGLKQATNDAKFQKNEVQSVKKAESNMKKKIEKDMDQLMKTGLVKGYQFVQSTKDLFDLIDGNTARYQNARHGSHAKFDRFDSSHMGEGVGNQAQGWGHYFVVDKGRARLYADKGIEGNRNLYEVELPDPIKKDTPTGRNYLYNKKIYSGSQVDKFLNRAKDTLTQEQFNTLKEYVEEWNFNGGKIMGENLYSSLSRALGGDKQASKFLESLGYDGLTYKGGRDGEVYVIFNDDAIKIKNHIQYLKDNQGNVAGATLPDGTVIFVEDALRADTAFHETSHRLVSFAQENSPELYNAIKKIAEEAPQELKDYVRKTYGDMSPESFIDEVFAWRQGKYSSVKADKWYNRMWEAVKRLWDDIRIKFGKEYANLDVFEGWEKMNSEQLMKEVDKLLKGGKEVGEGRGSETRYQLSDGRPNAITTRGNNMHENRTINSVNGLANYGDSV